MRREGYQVEVKKMEDGKMRGGGYRTGGGGG